MYRDVSLKSLKSAGNVATEAAAPISEVLQMLRDAAGRIEGEPAHLVRDAMKVGSFFLFLFFLGPKKIRK